MTHAFERRVFAVKNMSGVAWPPFAIAKLGAVVSRDGMESERPTHAIDKPNGDDSGIFVVNGSVTIASGGISMAVFWKQADYVRVLATEDVELNDEVGPVADEWACSLDGSGLIVQDEKDTQNVAPVVAASGGGGVELSHGLVIEQCNAGCSTYRVQRVHRYLKPVCDAGSGSGSGAE